MQVPVDQCHFFNFDSLPYCRDQPLAASNQISDLEEFLMCEFLSCKISAFINKNWHGSLGIGSVSWKQLCICKWDMLILIWQKHVQYILAWQMQHFDTFWGNNTGTKKILPAPAAGLGVQITKEVENNGRLRIFKDARVEVWQVPGQQSIYPLEV